MDKHSPEFIIRHIQDHPEPFLEIKSALRILGDKWSMLILVALFNNPRRFTDLQALLNDISPRTLSQKLQSLEEAGMITKYSYKEFPPRTEYSITDKSLDLKPVLKELKQWANKHCKHRPKGLDNR